MPARKPAPLLAGAAVIAVAVALATLALPGARGPASSPAPRPSASLPGEQAGDVHVAPGGDDAAAGTAQAPMATVEAALARLPRGGTIRLGAGTIRPFTIDGSRTGRVTIVGSANDGSRVDGGDADAAIRIADTSDVTIAGITVQGPAGSARTGIVIERSHGIRIAGAAIRDLRGGFGIDVRYSSDVVIEGSDIGHAAVAIRLFGEGDPGSVDAVVIDGNWLHDSDSMVVDDAAPDNDFGANGIIWHEVSGVTVARGNQVWNNRATSHDYGFDGGAFEIWGSSNVEIEGNTAWDNVNVLETGTNGPSCEGLRFVRNTAYVTDRGVGLILRCAQGGLIAHNVVDGVDGYAFELSDRGTGNQFASSIDGLRIVDNVALDTTAYAIRNEIDGTLVIDHNVLWNPRGPLATVPGGRPVRLLAAFTGTTGFDAHSVQADPRFADAAGRDYRLRAGSPAIDLGIETLGEAFSGAAPDAGRFELDDPGASPTG